MLLKLQYVDKIPPNINDDGYRYAFLIGPGDKALLGIKSMAPLSFSKAREDSLSAGGRAQKKDGLIIELPFRPDFYDAKEPYPGQLERMSPGKWYWVMIAESFKSPSRSHQFEGKGIRGVVNPVYRAVGIYPIVGSADLKKTIESARRLPAIEFKRNPAFSEKATSLIAALTGGDPFDEEEQTEPVSSVDTLVRIWGAVLGYCHSSTFLKRGEELATEGRLNQPNLQGMYRHYCELEKDEYEAPLLSLVGHLSDPEVYGSLGALLPYAMIAWPYSFVGPSSNPGLVSPNTPGETLFPFWVVDLLARAMFPTPHVEDRVLAVVHEAILHLEGRNHRAFSPKGEPGLRFDTQGPIPSGSTMFPRSLIYEAIRRRHQDLEEQGQQGSEMEIYMAGSKTPSPYKALSGWLGVPLEPIPLRNPGAPTKQGYLSVDHAVSKLCERVESVAASTNPEPWYTLQTRVNAAKEIIGLLRTQEDLYAPDILPVDPPDDDGSTPDRVLSPSQGAASRMVIRWRISCVTGDPGSGKSHLLKEFKRFALELEQAEPTCLLVLTPTNRAASRVASLLDADDDLLNPVFLFTTSEPKKDEDKPPRLPRNYAVLNEDGQVVEGAPEEDAHEMLTFTVGVGTLDSFFHKFHSSERFREAILYRKVLVAIDETSMVTAEKVVRALALFRDEEEEQKRVFLSQRVRRVIFLGDPSQLESVEPGNFFYDILRTFPITYLGEQFRYDGRLAHLFGLVRSGMTFAQARSDTSHLLLEAAGLTATTGEDPNLRVYMVDDLPLTDMAPPGFRRPDEKDYWNRFLLRTEESIRTTIFREVMDWSRVHLENGGSFPRRAVRGSAREFSQGTRDYQRFSKAAVQPVLPFRIVTMVRTPQSESGRTFYLSSSTRVNGWFHDVLLGRLVPDDPNFEPVPGMELNPTLKHFGSKRYWNQGVERPDYSADYEREWQRGREYARMFLFNNRPRDIWLSPNWPYLVKGNDFRRYGVLRGEVIYYRSTSWSSRRRVHLHEFESEMGVRFAIPPRNVTPRHLQYGWAVNVHQVQGLEYPLVIVLWFSGISPNSIRASWNAIRPTHEVTDPLPVGWQPGYIRGEEASLDERLSIRALYTGITRTITSPTQGVRTGKTRSPQRMQPGRCVIIAGKHALRRYLGLQVFERVTPFTSLMVSELERLM